MIWIVLLCSLALSAPPAAAQVDPEYDPRVLEGCLQAAWFRGGDLSTCIGVGAAHCLTSEAGRSTVGLGYCFSEEWAQWDARMNRVYQLLLVEQAQLDADNQAYNASLPSGVETLRAQQRAWLTFRDAACLWEAVQWGGGTGGGPASAQCMMELTATQTLFLEARLQ